MMKLTGEQVTNAANKAVSLIRHAAENSDVPVSSILDYIGGELAASNEGGETDSQPAPAAAGDEGGETDSQPAPAAAGDDDGAPAGGPRP